MQGRSPSKLPSVFERIRRFLDARAARDAERIRTLEAECEELRSHLHASDERVRTRGEVFYELQRQYSTEHFELQESMHNLRIERMRNAGMFADRDIILNRAAALQERIRSLKDRLRKHESVEDMTFDEAPIVIQDAAPDQGAGPAG